MSNLLDFQRLSKFVEGIVNPKFRAITQSITSASGYLKSLANEASGYAQQALSNASAAQASASDADGAASSTLIVWNSFTSTYGGVNTNDPSVSQLNNPFNQNAFYIRKSDGRFRYATSVNAQGVVTWADATVSADANSIISAGTGIFLRLNYNINQTIVGPVSFQSNILVPRVTAWGSQQATPAVDVQNMMSAIQQALSNEITRATAAENQKVSRSDFTFGTNPNGFWRKSPDNFVEQWGTIGGGAEGTYRITFPIAFTNPQTVRITGIGVNSAQSNRYDTSIQRVSVDANGLGAFVYVQYSGTNNINFIEAIDWTARGY